MFDLVASAAAGTTAAVALRSDDLAALVTALRAVDRHVDDAERIDQLRALEEIKSACSAAQARISVDFDASQRARQEAAGAPAAKVGAGIAAQVALARRDSPHRGGRHLGLAKVLVHEMPHTLRALEGGRLSEWRATLLARETACLALEARTTVDRELCEDPATLDGVGDAKLVALARARAYELDPQAAVRRARRAESARRVTIRPAPDTMCYLTALLPVAQGVAAYAALRAAADTARAVGDTRGAGQVMADTLVERVTGQARAEAVPVTVNLVMSDRTLLANDDEHAHLDSVGPVPASIARAMATADDGSRTWLRRLYASPTSGELVATDGSARRFPAGLARLVRLRDQRCRTPWCDAPVRHIDHAVAHTSGGSTTAANAQALCEACNYNKQAIGWRASPRPGPRHTVDTTTPTGHTYSSTAPAAEEPAWRELQPGVWVRAA